ncbi:hypothetical protein AAF712_005431 [Marasmius tenuissimus]|uniref:Uncharacterized protein n=1 Tax=Marasmius tenuissimus TaxID=585030 RepID=A0ABR3A238_9AGAR|nr:hypothetical protein PM082_008866 [Marasmius tenuissimus]
MADFYILPYVFPEDRCRSKEDEDKTKNIFHINLPHLLRPRPRRRQSPPPVKENRSGASDDESSESGSQSSSESPKRSKPRFFPPKKDVKRQEDNCGEVTQTAPGQTSPGLPEKRLFRSKSSPNLGKLPKVSSKNSPFPWGINYVQTTGI